MLIIERILVNLGYFLMLLGLIVRDILWLRSILMSGQLLLACYAIMINNHATAFWNTLFFLINTFQVIRLIRERKPIKLPTYLEELHKEIFSVMTQHELLYFWNLGSKKKTNNDLLIQEGEHLDELLLILSGNVDVIKNGNNITTLSSGDFIAEMSFLTEEPATADIVAKGEIEYITWNQEKLRSLGQLNPELLIKIQNILGKDLVNKIKDVSSKYSH